MDVRGAELGMGCGFCMKAGVTVAAEGKDGVGFAVTSGVVEDGVGLGTDGRGFAGSLGACAGDGCAGAVGCAALCTLGGVSLSALSTAGFFRVPASYTSFRILLVDGVAGVAFLSAFGALVAFCSGADFAFDVVLFALVAVFAGVGLAAAFTAAVFFGASSFFGAAAVLVLAFFTVFFASAAALGSSTAFFGRPRFLGGSATVEASMVSNCDPDMLRREGIRL